MSDSERVRALFLHADTRRGSTSAPVAKASSTVVSSRLRIRNLPGQTETELHRSVPGVLNSEPGFAPLRGKRVLVQPFEPAADGHKAYRSSEPNRYPKRVAPRRYLVGSICLIPCARAGQRSDLAPRAELQMLEHVQIGVSTSANPRAALGSLGERCHRP